jgi:transposase
MKGNETILIGKRHNSLYKLLLRVVQPSEQAQVLIASINRHDTLQQWHERLGHQNKAYVEKFLKKRGIKYVKDNKFCEGCVLGKHHRVSFGTRPKDVSRPGDLIHSDVCGPMQEESYSGFKYFVTFKDEYSKYRRVYFLKHKSEVPAKLKVFLAETKTLGHVVKELLTDGGGEYSSKELEAITQDAGLQHHKSMPYTPEQNGAAERENRILVEAARSMLQTKSLPQKLWAEAVNTAAYILNLSGPTKVDDKTPFELWHGKTATTTHLKIFGTECYVHIPKQCRRKLDAKAVKGYLVGYTDDHHGYRVYLSGDDDVVLSRDVMFLNEDVSVCDNSNVSEGEDIVTDAEYDANIQFDNKMEDVAGNMQNDPNQQAEDTVDPHNSHILRDRQLMRRPAHLEDYAMIATGIEPISYTEAMQSSDSSNWQHAMYDEMSSLMENGTWTLVNKPRDRPIVNSKWVYKIKLKADSTINRYKARLVAKGYSQQQGIDYDETFSPVVRFDTIRMLLSIAARENLILSQFDVKTAFLYGDLEDEIYMQQPEGFNDGSGRVCRLLKSLYGLKQAPRCWNKKFTSFLEKHGLKPSDADPCLFISSVGEHKLLLMLYVDDGLVAYKDNSQMNGFLAELATEFQITSCDASNFLGFEIKRYENGTITINQEAYIKQVLKRFNMLECNAVTTPVDKGQDHCTATAVYVGDQVPYREVVGSLMYLAMGTRLDIAYGVSVLSRVLNKPTANDWSAAKRILRYLKGTSKTGLVYSAERSCEPLVGYSDADYAGDVITRRSTTGVVCVHGGTAVSWLSQLQKSVSLSTMEAEIIAASEAAKEIIWLVRMCKEVTVENSVPVLNIDNMSTVKLVKNPIFHKRSKHIEVRNLFVREQYENNVIAVNHIASNDQLADILTKPLPRVRFLKLCKLLGLQPC